MAHALAIASGKPIEYRQRDLEDVAARSTDIAAMYRYLDQIGYQVDIPNLRNRFPEVPWTSFADWARQQVTPH